MNYFPPKSIITWNETSGQRRGYFEILPLIGKRIPDTFDTYDTYTKQTEKGYCASAYIWAGVKQFEITSPYFELEEDAIRWLEVELIKISKDMISKYNAVLSKQINLNNEWLEKLEGFVNEKENQQTNDS